MNELNITPRDYQNAIFETCKEKDCLVVLPTGTGKTLIALMMAVYRFKKFPLEKIVILAPTRPLIEQHFEYFKNALPEGWADMQLFTGKTPAEKRKKIWQTAEFIFSTPQCIANDLDKILYKLDEVSLLIVDECHRCLKNYAYNRVAQKYKIQSTNPRVLALTASPGSDKETITNVCDNLGIKAVEIRTRESEDVKPYLQELEFERIDIEFPPEFMEIKLLLKQIYDKKVSELKHRRVLFGYPSKTTLLKTQATLMKSIGRSRNINNMLAVSACATALKISHALTLLETQTISSFIAYLKDLFKQAAEKKSKGVQKLIRDPCFAKAYALATTLNKEHPKLQALKEIVEEQFKKNPDSRIIIFAQFRETVRTISEELNKTEGIKAENFVGQAMKDHGEGRMTGLKQSEQKEMVEKFRAGEINVLVATSIHPKEFIVLKKDKKITIKKIGEFVESFLENDKKAKSQKIKGWKALTTNGEKTFFKPITHIHRHKTQNKVINTKLSSGFDCLITENHSLFSFNSKKQFIPSPPKKNKFVSLTLNCPNIEHSKKIDIFNELSNKDHYNLFGSIQNISQSDIRILKTDKDVLNVLVSRKGSIIEISNISRRNYSTVSTSLKRMLKRGLITQIRDKKNYKNISSITKKGKTYFNSLNWFFKNVKYQKGKYRFHIKNQTPKNLKDFFEQRLNINYGKVSFPREINLNESLARFLGFYVSEGHARKTTKTSQIFLAALNKKIRKLMQESILNGLKLTPRVSKRGIAIDSQVAYILIKEVFKAGIGSYNKEVPEIIFTAPKNIKWEFLRAYFLGDGYADNQRIIFTTVSRKLVTGIVLLLRMLGIQKITIHKNKHIYKLCVSESLPFAKVKEKMKNKGHAYYSLIPTAIENKKAFEKYKNFYSKSNSHQKCRKNGVWKNDTCFDFIKEVKKIKGPEFVYDLSVKDTENFIGGTGLICFHNSIAEEGLDIPEVNEVIFYEPIPSAIRSIQRRGRTARLSKGALKILVTKKTLDEVFHYTAYYKEKRMHKAIDEIKEGFENGERQETLK